MTVSVVAAPTFVAMALAVVAAGMVTGAFVGNGRTLFPVALLLTAVLAVAAAIPSFTVGERTVAPSAAVAMEDSYDLGVGQVVLDLTDVQDPAGLSGRTVRITEGFGSVRVILPDDLPVSVRATSRGHVQVFDRTQDGGGAVVTYADPPGPDGTPPLELVVGQTAGEIVVSRS